MRTRNQSRNLYWPMVIGVVLAVILSTLSAALGAVFIDNESIQIGAIPYISYAVWAISSFLCAYFSGRAVEGKWLLRSGIATGIYYIILLGTGILIFGGATGDIIYGLIAVLAGFAGSVLIIFKKQKAPGNRKMRHFKIK